MPGSAAILDPSDTYRREARRLRCRFAGQPARLQQSLKRLAAGAPRATPRPVERPGRAPHPRPASVQTGPARLFADYLLDHTPATMTVLRYSQRLEFLRAARRLGVGRFEANLLIAAVLEQRRTRPPADTTEAADTGSVVSGLAALALIETAVLLGAWWTLFGS